MSVSETISGRSWDEGAHGTWISSLFGGGKSGNSSQAYQEFNRYLSTLMPFFQEQYGGMFGSDMGGNPAAGKFQDLMTQNLQGSDAAVAALPQELTQAAMQGQQQQTLAGVLAARNAVGGRGGYGGQTSALAAQMGQQSAANIGSGLLSAKLSGLEATTGYGMQKASALTQALQGETAIGENRRAQAIDYQKQMMQTMFGLSNSALVQGLQGEASKYANKPKLSLFGLFK